tara:strand:- start:2522 stop:4231 length:1710 start_codon:yes stop_codon:yes gene_type:complete
LLLIGCSGSDGESVSTLEASVTSSNDAPLYDETYTISWESNASQCYATSTTGSWIGELEPSGSQDFIAKREGTANYGVQCRKSINFVNASTDVVVNKDFIDYFDFDDAQTYDLGSLNISSDANLNVLDTSISDFNGDFRLDIVLLLEDSGTINVGDSSYFILAFYGRDLSTIDDENPYVFIEINQGNCVADKLIRADYNEDGVLDIMAISASEDESLNKRGICFFLASEDGLALQDENYLINETTLDLSNVDIGSFVAYDLTSNLRPDIMLLGNGGTTDLPFYIVPSDAGPSIALSNPLNTLDPYTRTQGCTEGISFLCEWISSEYHFEDSVVINADTDGILDTIHSINTSNGPTYTLYNTRFEDVYIDWSLSVEDYISTSISTGDGVALRMAPTDGNLDGRTDLFLFEKSLSSNTFKLSIYEKVVSEEDSIDEITRTNNGDFAEEYLFQNNLKFSNELLLFDLDNNGFADIFIPYTELPYDQGNINSDKHFFAFEKSYIVNEDDTSTQDWLVQDFSESVGLDSESINNSWIDFDADNDIDVILMIPVVSNDGLSINYNFRLFINNSLF